MGTHRVSAYVVDAYIYTFQLETINMALTYIPYKVLHSAYIYIYCLHMYPHYRWLKRKYQQERVQHHIQDFVVATYMAHFTINISYLQSRMYVETLRCAEERTLHRIALSCSADYLLYIVVDRKARRPLQRGHPYRFANTSKCIFKFFYNQY